MGEGELVIKLCVCVCVCVCVCKGGVCFWVRVINCGELTGPRYAGWEEERGRDQGLVRREEEGEINLKMEEGGRWAERGGGGGGRRFDNSFRVAQVGGVRQRWHQIRKIKKFISACFGFFSRVGLLCFSSKGSGVRQRNILQHEEPQTTQIKRRIVREGSCGAVIV